MWSQIAKIILRYRLPLLLAIMAITAFMAYKAKDVEIAYSGGKVLPVTDPSYKDYTDFKTTFGEDGNVMVVGVQSPELFKKDFFTRWYRLSEEILHQEGVAEVVSITRIFELRKDTATHAFKLDKVVKKEPVSQEEIDSLKRKLYALPFYNGLLINKEANASLMAITFQRNKLNIATRLDLVKKITERCKEVSRATGVDMHFSGIPYIRTIISAKLSREFELFLAIAICIAASILLLFFRNFAAVFFPVLVVGVGVIWALGTLVLFGFKITLLTGLIPPLIVVIGIPNSVLLLNKYHSDFRKHGDKLRALSMMIQRIGITTFIANLTTAIGFGVFYFTHSEILTEFGVVAAINIMATYASSLILIPIVFSYLPPPSARHTKHLESKIIRKIIDTTDHWVHVHRKRIYWTTAIIIIISAIGVWKININGYIIDDVPKNDPIAIDLKFFETNFQGIVPLELDINTGKKNGVLSSGLITRINAVEKVMSEYPEFSKPVSLNEALKFSTQAFYNGNPDQYRIPTGPERAFILMYAQKMKSNGNLLRSFVDSTKSRTHIAFQVQDLGSKKMNHLLKKITPRIDSIFKDSGYDVKLTGSSVVFVKGNNYLVRNLYESLLLAIFLIAIIMWLLFRTRTMILISLLPNLIPLLITAGLMGFFGISLKPSTILIFSIAFGLASDQTIYFLSKYRQEFLHKNKNQSISKTVSISLHETGRSMIYTAIILFFGFGIFTLSTFGGTLALGVLVSVTLLFALISNLIFLPALLLSLEKRIKRKSLQDPLIAVYDEEEEINLDELKIK